MYSLSTLCLRLSQLSQSFVMQYMGLCSFSLHVPFVMIVGISNRKYDLFAIVQGEVMEQWHKLLVFLCSISSFNRMYI